MAMVSIVMTTYNGEKYVEEQIKSILSSAYQDFELYIQDDGSTDGTMDILRKYESLYPNQLHVSQNEVNLGVTLNFLQSVCKTTTDYIMFCDQDDVWKSNKISVTLKRLRHMEAQHGKGIPIAVFTDAIVADQNLRVIRDSFFKAGNLNPNKTDLSHLLMENKLIGCTVMINSVLRKVLQSHNLPGYARYHDWWIALIASAFGKIGFINEGTLLYRQHERNMVGNQGFALYFKDRITSLKKQRNSLQALQLQAKEFVMLYEDLLIEENRIIIERFANLNHVNFIKRRIDIIRYGYLKTGLVRNIGLIFIV